MRKEQQMMSDTVDGDLDASIHFGRRKNYIL